MPTLGKEDMARMREAIEDIELAHRRDDLSTISEASRRFHFTLFDAAEMPRMAEMIRVIWESTDRYRSLYFSS